MADGNPIKLNCVLLCLGLVWFPFSACSVDLRSRSPYPPSPVIRSISWDFDNLIKKAPGSDLWPMTWASDDNLYTSWGDGDGFGGTNRLGRVSLGFARIEGSPSGFSARNVWGGQGAERKPAFTGKCPGMLSIDGTLYAWVRMPAAGFLHYRLAWSRNLGRDWQLSNCSFPDGGDRFVAKTFVNFGRDYQGAPDDFVYIYGGEVGRTDRIYLLRVPRASLWERRAYMFYTGSGTDDKPAWSTRASDRVPVFIDPDSSSNAATVVYNAGLKRFIMTLPH